MSKESRLFAELKSLTDVFHEGGEGYQHSSGLFDKSFRLSSATHDTYLELRDSSVSDAAVLVKMVDTYCGEFASNNFDFTDEHVPTTPLGVAAHDLAEAESADVIPEIDFILNNKDLRVRWRTLFATANARSAIPFLPHVGLSSEFFALRTHSLLARRFGIGCVTSDNNLSLVCDTYFVPCVDAKRRIHDVVSSARCLVLGGVLKFSAPSPTAARLKVSDEMEQRRKIASVHLRFVKNKLQNLEERLDSQVKRAATKGHDSTNIVLFPSATTTTTTKRQRPRSTADECLYVSSLRKLLATNLCATNSSSSSSSTRIQIRGGDDSASKESGIFVDAPSPAEWPILCEKYLNGMQDRFEQHAGDEDGDDADEVDSQMPHVTVNTNDAGLLETRLQMVVFDEGRMRVARSLRQKMDNVLRCKDLYDKGRAACHSEAEVDADASLLDALDSGCSSTTNTTRALRKAEAALERNLTYSREIVVAEAVADCLQAMLSHRSGAHCSGVHRSGVHRSGDMDLVDTDEELPTIEACERALRVRLSMVVGA
ncbi:MAG: hypothetical protein CMJ93_08625 [Planctomycetes bacterium]|nr:hypothetical protein [Planctomycetota bacterium]